jgi:endonuclease/exonuclease/phosphatase family metal-dependent hydrolase
MVETFKRVAFIIEVSYLILMLLLAIAQLIVQPSEFQDVVRSLIALLLLPAILFLFVALLIRNWRLLGLTLIPSLAALLVYVPYIVPRHPSAPAISDEITLLTFNIQTPKQDVDSLTKVIQAADADIVGVQELSPEAAQEFHEKFGEAYPYQTMHPDEQYAGQGIMSRFPILEEFYWRNQDLPITYGHLRVVVDVNGTKVIVYSVHPVAAFASDRGFSLELHSKAVDDVLDRTRKDAGPLILLGDFNMTSQFDEYNQITAHYVDTFLEAGKPGLGFTYPHGNRLPLPPLLRLDYIFHNAELRGIEARVWPDSGSADHLPVFVKLAFL